MPAVAAVASELIHYRRIRLAVELALRTGPTDIFPLDFRRQVEAEPRLAAQAAEERVFIHGVRHRPRAPEFITADSVMRDPLDGLASVILEVRRILSHHEFILALRHLEDAHVERMRDLELEAVRVERTGLDALEDEAFRLVRVLPRDDARLAVGERADGDRTDGIVHRLGSGREVDADALVVPCIRDGLGLGAGGLDTTFEARTVRFGDGVLVLPPRERLNVAFRRTRAIGRAHQRRLVLAARPTLSPVEGTAQRRPFSGPFTQISS